MVATPTRELAVQVAGEVSLLYGGGVDKVALLVEEAEVRG
jgi:superfamily II DNA/RNA helicase